VIVMEEPAKHRHFWVQAPVPALDVDGLAVVTVGTAIFGVVSVLFAFAYDWLATHGHGSWLQISVAGFALGLVGLAYCWRRRRRRRAIISVM
jgi:MYXO-CTERM domain-containing protein